MTDQLLLSYACEMLSRTNPYQKGVESFHYHCSQKDEISLLSLIDNHPDIRGHRMSSDKRLGKQKNIRTCFRAISNAMVTYMKSYPAASSCKSRMKEKFVLWLEAIRKEYQITDTDCSIPEALYPAEGEKDTVVMLLKSLQARGGITKKELQDNLGISPRAILKDLCKLDPSLGKTGDLPPDDDIQPFYLGGQPVTAKIRAIKKPGERANSYMTVNTIHPLILQENLMQAGTLLLALARNWHDHDSNLSLCIGADIWFQLTLYAQERIRTVFISIDPVMAEFLGEIDRLLPDDQLLQSYQTEREMMREQNDLATPPDRLTYLSKAASRTCSNLVLETEDGPVTLRNVRITPAEDTEGGRGFLAVSDDESEIFFLSEQMADIYE